MAIKNPHSDPLRGFLMHLSPLGPQIHEQETVMQQYHPLCIHRWPIKPFYSAIVAIVLGLGGCIVIEDIGLAIPLIRSILGFVFLSFVPGFIILRLLRLDDLGPWESVLYAHGLSLAVTMFAGLVVNSTVLVGLENPIAPYPLYISISLLVMALAAAAYLREPQKPSHVLQLQIEELTSSPLLLLASLPFLTIIGTFLVNTYESGILLMLVISLIVLLFLAIVTGKWISPEYYPFALWIFAISLLWHNSLISPYINVCDVVSEYLAAKIVITNGWWDWTIYENFNSVLSSTMLAPVFHWILGLDLTWVFKIIFPFSFSLVAPATYRIFLSMVRTPQIAFLSTFFLISIQPFFEEVAFITKQSTAELFLVLFMLLIFSKALDRRYSVVLYLFGAAIIVSHYGISYTLGFAFGFVILISAVLDRTAIKRVLARVGYGDNTTEPYPYNRTIPLGFFLFYCTFTFLWYYLASGSSVLDHIAMMWEQVVTSISKEMLNPEHSRGLYLVTRTEASFLHTASKALYIVSQGLIVIGFSKIVLKPRKSFFSRLYMVFSFFFLIVLVAAVLHTSLSAMDPRRLFQLCSFFLAPFAVIGGISLFSMPLSIFHQNARIDIHRVTQSLMGVFLVIFLLFNTGFVFEIANDHPRSIALSQESVVAHGDYVDRAVFYGNIISRENVLSGQWLSEERNASHTVYRGDLVQGYPALTIYGDVPMRNIEPFSPETEAIGPGYVHLTYGNVVGGVGSSWYNPLQIRTSFNMSEVSGLLAPKSTIYSNGGSLIMWSGT